MEPIPRRGQAFVSSSVAHDVKPRPVSLILSSPSTSHMPGSIFPDIPSPPPSLSPVSRYDMSRRHTTYLAPSPRRDLRPLRSSPLAGPSIAIDGDGTLTKKGEYDNDSNADLRPRYRPNRISSSPEVSSIFSRMMDDESLAGTSNSSSSGNHSVSHSSSETAESTSTDATSVTATEEAIKPSKRLSWGLIKLPSLPSMSSHSRSKSLSKGSSHSQPPQPSPPPVPPIPVWALPSHTRGPSPVPSNLSQNRQRVVSHSRRPSTSPGTPSRLSYVGVPDPLSQSRNAPSTSRNPELNWMSQAAPPKFSRLSLRAEGVVLPVSVKEMRRRSTIYGSEHESSSSVNSRTISEPEKAKIRETKSSPPSRMPSSRSLRSLVSLSSLTSSSEPIPVPAPPFRTASRHASTSSIETSASSIPPSTTPSLSRTTSNASLTEDEFGVTFAKSRSSTPSPEFQKTTAVMGVEVRVNDVCVDVIPTSRRRERTISILTPDNASARSTATVHVLNRRPSALRAPNPTQQPPAKVAKRGTIKRVWKRVIGSMRR